jgi:uncharacterized protein (TIGR02453 family)
MDSHFTGFTPETIHFLQSLRTHNTKSWFEAHRRDYQRHLLQPLQGLVTDLSEFMLTIDPWFETRPLIDKTISRIYRDTRFTKDKSPYKTRMWITFKRLSKDWKDAPAYFFEISPEGYRYGMGFYSASRATMARFREVMDTKPAEFADATAFYAQQDTFILAGEQYKRILDENKPAALQAWYQRKNLYLVCRRPAEERLFRPDLVQVLETGFGMLAPFYHFLRKISDQSADERFRPPG